MRYWLLLTALMCALIVCVLTTPIQLCAAAQTSQAATAEDSAVALLHEAAQRSAELRTLYALFTQEKKLSILDAPLISSGYMCLERPGEAGGAGRERVLWVYEKPTPSGFAQEGGEAWLWTGQDAARRKAQGAEAAALKAVAAQILAWVHIQPEAMQGLYRMRRVDAPSAAEPVLRLEPRQSGAFFAALEVTLAPDLTTVRQLRFEEKNGDSTLLRFHDARVNAALPAACAPSRSQPPSRP